MVELVALVLADVTRRLWHCATPGRTIVVALWIAYGAGVPDALVWAEQTLPEEVNLALPFAGVLAATVEAIRHYRHKRQHHADVKPQVRDGVS